MKEIPRNNQTIAHHNISYSIKDVLGKSVRKRVTRKKLGKRYGKKVTVIIPFTHKE